MHSTIFRDSVIKSHFSNYYAMHNNLAIEQFNNLDDANLSAYYWVSKIKNF